jgi:hypothetical protein
VGVFVIPVVVVVVAAPFSVLLSMIVGDGVVSVSVPNVGVGDNVVFPPTSSPAVPSSFSSTSPTATPLAASSSSFSAAAGGGVVVISGIQLTLSATSQVPTNPPLTSFHNNVVISNNVPSSQCNNS